jgi:hypothetical protein
MIEYNYHVYSKGEVLYVNLTEAEFNRKIRVLKSSGIDYSFERVFSKLPAGDDSY